MSWPGLEEDVVGIDISEGIVTVARVKPGPPGAGLRLCNAGFADVPAGSPTRETAATIRRLWRTSGMPSSTVCASFRGKSVIVRYFRYPALTRAEVESALRLEAEESLQLRQADILMDWHFGRDARRTAEGGGSRPCEGLLVAAPRRDVEQHLELLRAAGLYPVTLDIGATAVANVYRTLHPAAAEGRDVGVVHLTRQCADLALLFDQGSLYARTIYARGADWESSFDSLVEGLKDALKYYEFKLRRQPVGRLMVMGQLPGKAGVEAVLGRELGVPVEVWNPLTALTPASFRVKRLLGRQLPSMAISLGLALRRFDDA